MSLARTFAVATAAAVVAATSTLVAAPAFAAPPAPTVLAPAEGGAEQGGAVIVLLKDGLTGLSLRDQPRTAQAHADQAPLVADMKAHGAQDVLQLVSVNGIGATLSAAEVARLRAFPQVKEVIPDVTVTVDPREDLGQPATAAQAKQLAAATAKTRAARAKSARPAATARAKAATPDGTPGSTDGSECTSDPDKPMLEPEALTVLHVASDDPNAPDEANSIATGKGVVVANAGINQLSGNPNFTRADGSHVVVDAPTYTADDSDGEYYGDASSIAAQGTVVYNYGTELPYSGLSTSCTFVIRGVAPDASLVDDTLITTPPSAAGDPATASEAQVVASIDAAVRDQHADIISESYGFANTPASYVVHYAANDAAVAAGVTVVVSSGDSGPQGTVSSPATDPLVIAAGATNTLRLNAQAYGYSTWANGTITPLSSGGAAPGGKLVDIVAPGYGGEAACSPSGSDCPTNTATEAFGGTSEAAPLVAGIAADVIQAYRDSHDGTSPTPALVKQILTGTADDLGAPADEQGAGQVDAYAAVRAAQEEPGSSVSSDSAGDAPSLIPSPTQLDVSGDEGSTSSQSVTLYNTGSTDTSVTGTFRELGPKQPLNSTVTEAVSAPDPSLPVPAEGAQAASPIQFSVPAGLDQLDTDMIWPDATNGTILSYDLIDPNGALSQISYDYGVPSTRAGRIGTVPNIGHVEVAHPIAGTWTAIIRWANGRSHLQSAPNVPGTYTGNLSFRETGQTFVTAPAAAGVVVPAHGSASVPLSVLLPQTAGDHPESVQFTADDGATLSLPVDRRSTIPSTGGTFSTPIEATVGRGIGQLTTYDVTVPAGTSDLDVSLTASDTSADNPFTFYLVQNPGQTTEKVIAEDSTPATTSQQTGDAGNGALVYANPAPGVYEIDVKLNLTESGNEFDETVNGTVAFNRAGTPLSALPASVPTGSAGRTVLMPVTNPTNVGRTFTLTSSGSDVSGPIVTTGVYVGAGQTLRVPVTVTTSQPTGSTVNDTVTLLSNASTTARNLTTQTIASGAYSYAVVPVPRPVVSSISPVTGPPAGGTQVVLTGSGLTGTTQVVFGGVAASSVTVVSDTEVDAVSPAESPSAHYVYATTAGGTSAATNHDLFTFAGPAVDALTPQSGSVGGGTPVVLRGIGFTGATAVVFGGTAARSFTVVSDTEIDAVSPASTPSQRYVYVRTPQGTSGAKASNLYTFTGPVLSSISPSSGPKAGGTTVVLTGSGFSAATEVLFGGTPAAFTVVSDTEIDTVSPAGGPDSKFVYVRTAQGTSAAYASDLYTYRGPVLTGLSPASGPSTGGTSVLIEGTGFTGATSVLFGNVAATSFTVNSDTSITAVTPAEAPSMHNTFVVTPDGTSQQVGADAYTFVSSTAATPV